MCGADLLLTWFIVGLLHFWHVAYDEDSGVSRSIVMVSSVANMSITLLEILVLMRGPIGGWSAFQRCAITGLFAGIIVNALFLVVWLPYVGYTWTATVLTTGLLLIVVVILACCFGYWRMNYRKMFGKSKHKSMTP